MVSRPDAPMLQYMCCHLGKPRTMRPRSRVLCRPVTVLLLVLTALACSAPGEARRPVNIIVIMVDTLRADYLGSYGFEGPVSPHLDALAAESVRFEHCISQAPWTKPSVASLFTSLHPETHRVTDHDDQFWRDVDENLKTSALPEEAITLAEVLRTNGYATAAWVGNSWLSEGLGFGQGFDDYQAPERRHVQDADEVWGDVWYWLVRHRKESPEKPFFWYLHVMDVHGPYRPPPEDVQAVSESSTLGEERLLDDAEFDRIPNHILPTARSGAPHELRTVRALYAGGIRAFDRRLGQFLERLDNAGLVENTLLLLVSDHGEELGEHGGWDHGDTLHAEQTRVPCVIRSPQLPAGTVDEIVSLVDFMPTLLGAAAASRPEGLQGRNLWPVLLGQTAPEPAWAFSGGVKLSRNTLSVRSKSHALLWNDADGAISLFDTREDPLEQRDLAESNPELRDELRDRLQLHQAELKKAGTLLTRQEELTREEIERLQSLGYLQ